MYELIRLSEHDYYVDCPAKIGLVTADDGTVTAIDSGNDKDAAKKVLRHIEANGWTLKRILNTHSHADHIGGNRFLQEKTGCRIFAPGMEAVYTSCPQLEPMTLFGGCPFKDLTGKFLMAQSSTAELLTPEVLPEGMELIPLPGHCFDMAGFRTPDGTVFLADCLSSEETLAKYGIGYLWDPAAYMETLEKVSTMTAARFVPSHAPVTGQIGELARINIRAVQCLLDRILDLCRQPRTFETLLHELFLVYGLMMNVQQYALIGSTVRSCLSALVTQGRMRYVCQDAYLLWQTTDE